MQSEVESIEVILLEELASTLEAIRLTDLQIREIVASCRWDEGHQLSVLLVNLLQEKRIVFEAIRQSLTALGRGHSAPAIQVRRCADMSSYLLSVVSKYLPIYERIVNGFIDKKNAGSVSSLEEKHLST